MRCAIFVLCHCSVDVFACIVLIVFHFVWSRTVVIVVIVLIVDDAILVFLPRTTGVTRDVVVRELMNELKYQLIHDNDNNSGQI